MNLRTDGGFFVLYTQQVLSVLVRERYRSILRTRGRRKTLAVRRRLAAGVYALAKAVTLVAVVLDDEPVHPALERAR